MPVKQPSIYWRSVIEEKNSINFSEGDLFLLPMKFYATSEIGQGRSLSIDYGMTVLSEAETTELMQSLREKEEAARWNIELIELSRQP